MFTITLLEHKKIPFSSITPLYIMLYAIYICRESSTNPNLFMQNKANLCRFQPKNNDYAQKQSQTNPNKANLKPICQMTKNERKLISNKGLWKFMHTGAKKTNPNKPNFKRLNYFVFEYVFIIDLSCEYGTMMNT